MTPNLSRALPVTTILSNGSKWAGEEPDPIEKLYEVLATEILDPRFEHHGGFVARRVLGDVMLFFGNFWERSHSFSVETDEPAVIARLEALIAANLARPEYARARAEYLASCKCRQCKPEQWGPARPLKYSWENPRPRSSGTREDSRMYEPKPGHARMFPSFCALEDGPPLDVPLAGAVIIDFEAQT